MSQTNSRQNNTGSVVLQNDLLKVSAVPAMGGKISSIVNKKLNREFLWINSNIPFQSHPPGSEYDPNFIGGIDELIPNDIPETIDDIDYPDHGELWTTKLDHVFEEDELTIHGILPLSGLYYSKKITLDESRPYIYLDYNIRNDTESARHFMWKLHAALRIAPGDCLVTPAKIAKVVDAEYSRFKNELQPFTWPQVEGTNASIVPLPSNEMDFFYLYEVPYGNMQLQSANGEHVFVYEYDAAVFPYQWWFASYGGFLGHYTAILEPCTNMPISVNDAINQKQTAFLDAGASLSTRVKIYAGKKDDYYSL